MPRLVITRDNQTLRTLELKAGTLTIGRTADNDVQLDDPSVGEHHARIATFFEVSYVERTDSSHSVELNGKPVQLCRLRCGDVMSVGVHYKILCQADEDATIEEATDGSPPASAARLYFLTGPEAGKRIELQAVTRLGEQDQTQAVIRQEADGYYLSCPEQGRVAVRVNERTVGSQPIRLHDKDVIELNGVLIAHYA